MRQTASPLMRGNNALEGCMAAFDIGLRKEFAATSAIVLRALKRALRHQNSFHLCVIPGTRRESKSC